MNNTDKLLRALIDELGFDVEKVKHFNEAGFNNHNNTIIALGLTFTPKTRQDFTSFEYKLVKREVKASEDEQNDTTGRIKEILVEQRRKIAVEHFLAAERKFRIKKSEEPTNTWQYQTGCADIQEAWKLYGKSDHMGFDKWMDWATSIRKDARANPWLFKGL